MKSSEGNGIIPFVSDINTYNGVAMPDKTFALQSTLKYEIDSLRESTEDDNKTLSEKIDQIEKNLYIVKTILAGNGDPSKSLVVRFDRMEQANQRRTWLIHAALGASISSFVGLVSFLIKHFMFP